MSYISKPVKIPDVPGKITLRERGDRVYVMKTQKDRPLVCQRCSPGADTVQRRNDAVRRGPADIVFSF